jgi:hypothetical protein
MLHRAGFDQRQRGPGHRRDLGIVPARVRSAGQGIGQRVAAHHQRIELADQREHVGLLERRAGVAGNAPEQRVGGDERLREAVLRNFLVQQALI